MAEVELNDHVQRQPMFYFQDINDEILIGAVFKHDRGFYQWMGGKDSTSTVPTVSTIAPSTNTCVTNLQDAPVGWGLNLQEATSEAQCFI